MLKIGASMLIYNGGIIQLIISFVKDWVLLVGIALYIIPAAIIIYLLRFIELTLLQPLLSLTYVTTPVLAYYFLDENLPIIRIMGITLIVLGVILVGKS